MRCVPFPGATGASADSGASAMAKHEDRSKSARRILPFGADLLPRLLSALVLVPLTALAVALGGVFFAVLVALVLIGAYWEWERMLVVSSARWPAFFLMGLIAIAALAYPILGVAGAATGFAVTILAGAVIPAHNRMWRVGGLFYFSLVALAFLSIRGTSIAGVWAGLFLVAITWTTDSGAYFVGRLVGGIKLSPDVSPSKTWSGAIGGLVIGTLGGLIVWLVARLVMGTGSPFIIGALIAVVTSIAGQAGDLAESGIKRRFLIKDSGDIIPGHGGLMDRIDSLAMAALVLGLIGLVHGGASAVPEGILLW